jgi:hypothetical protein
MAGLGVIDPEPVLSTHRAVIAELSPGLSYRGYHSRDGGAQRDMHISGVPRFRTAIFRCNDDGDAGDLDKKLNCFGELKIAGMNRTSSGQLSQARRFLISTIRLSSASNRA